MQSLLHVFYAEFLRVELYKSHVKRLFRALDGTRWDTLGDSDDRTIISGLKAFGKNGRESRPIMPDPEMYGRKQLGIAKKRTFCFTRFFAKFKRRYNNGRPNYFIHVCSYEHAMVFDFSNQ